MLYYMVLYYIILRFDPFFGPFFGPSSRAATLPFRGAATQPWFVEGVTNEYVCICMYVCMYVYIYIYIYIYIINVYS